MKEIFTPHSWQEICFGVSNITKNIVPYIKRKSVLSGIISNIFETYAAEYFNGKEIKTKSSENDKDPDLFFMEKNINCEIKVTCVRSDIIDKKVTWLGGRYSKRNCEHIFIMWNYNQKKENTLYEPNKEYFSFCVIKTIASPEDWIELSNSKDYYGVGFHSTLFADKQHDILVGDYKQNKFILNKFYI
jgi:hypothetical protein